MLVFVSQYLDFFHNRFLLLLLFVMVCGKIIAQHSCNMNSKQIMIDVSEAAYGFLLGSPWFSLSFQFISQIFGLLSSLCFLRSCRIVTLGLIFLVFCVFYALGNCT